MSTDTLRSEGVECFGLTDVGKARKVNEDHFVIASMRKSVRVRNTSLETADLHDRLGGEAAHLFVVADGVGGRPGGRMASGSAVALLLEYMGQATDCYHRLETDKEHELLERLELGVQAAHERIRRDSGDADSGPATTLTMVTLVGVRAYIVHVGDSRAYYLHSGRLRQITRDQTVREYMVDLGAWTEAQAARAPVAANLTSSVGGSEMTPSVGLIDLQPGDVLLMCTDGLTKHVSDERIAETLGRPVDTEAMCRSLVDEALQAGGSDNVTVIVARIIESAAG